MRLGVAFPSDAVLELLFAPKTPHSYHAFYFPFFFSFDKVRWWFREVLAMFWGLFVRR
jgi:hypothetical protein